MISWRVSLSKRWSARRRCLAVLDFITTWGHRGLPKWRKSKKGVEWWDNFSWESVKGQLSVLHLGGDWLTLPQALPYKCLALPGPCAVVAPALPVPQPQARPCQPMRSGRQGERRRCRHAWPHTPPSQLAEWTCLPECVGALCQALRSSMEEVCRGEVSDWRPVGLGCPDAAPVLGPRLSWCCSRRPVIIESKGGRAWAWARPII